MDDSSELSVLLRAVASGEQGARDRLMAAAYQELRELAARLMHGAEGHTLQPTALVHEAVLRVSHDQVFEQGISQSYFYGVMAQAMRRVLIDYARARNATKRGGNATSLPLATVLAALEEQQNLDILDLDEALSDLESRHPRMAEVVTLRFFGGLEMRTIADSLQVSLSTVEKDWKLARTWLRQRLSGDGPQAPA